MTTNCPQCQAVCQDEAKFCSLCGWRLKKQPRTPKAQPSTDSSRKPPIHTTWINGVILESSSDQSHLLVSDQQRFDQKLIRQVLFWTSATLLVGGILLGVSTIEGWVSGEPVSAMSICLFLAASFSLPIGLGATIGIAYVSDEAWNRSGCREDGPRPKRNVKRGVVIGIVSGAVGLIFSILIVVLVIACFVMAAVLTCMQEMTS